MIQVFRWIVAVATMALVSGCLSSSAGNDGTSGLALLGDLAPAPAGPFVLDGEECQATLFPFAADAAEVRARVPEPFQPIGAGTGKAAVSMVFLDCGHVAVGDVGIGGGATGGLFAPVAPADGRREALHLFLLQGFTNRADIAAPFLAASAPMEVAPAYAFRHPDLRLAAGVEIRVPLADGGFLVDGLDGMTETASDLPAAWVIWTTAGSDTLRLELDVLATHARSGAATLSPEPGSAAAALAGGNVTGPLATFDASFRGRAALLE